MTIILDMGGVLMNHNMPECIARFRDILGEENMKQILGLSSNGEGTSDSLMEQYERGDISTDTFIAGIQHDLGIKLCLSITSSSPLKSFFPIP